MSINGWRPKCPYLSSIYVDKVQCTLHAKLRNEQLFDNYSKVDKFTDSICFLNFDTCLAYQNIYAEEMASTDKYILNFRKCAFCCNSSGYVGLKHNYGGTHCYCQMHDVEVEKFNTNTVCEWFNKKAGTAINNILDMLVHLSCF